MKLTRTLLLWLALAVPALAADIKVSNMTAASALSGPELFYCVQGGADRKCTATQLKDFSVSSANIIAALGFTPANKAGDTLTGDWTILPGATLRPVMIGPVPSDEGFISYPGLTLSTEADRSVNITMFSATGEHFYAPGSKFWMFGTRGTLAAPEAVQNGDAIAQIYFGGHDGVASPANYNLSAAIYGEVAGTVSAGVVPVDIVFYTGSGNLDEAARIKANKNAVFAGHLVVEGVTSTGATGTGKFVFDASPTLVTPTLGVATATSINKVTITPPATSATLTIADGGTLAIAATPHIVNGRCTLTTGVPVTTTDVTGATTLYFTPYRGNLITLWNGSAWQAYALTQLSLALGTLSSGKNYDVFAYNNSGTPAIEMLAWTDDTNRATAVTLQDGRYAKSGDKTRLYVCTFRTTSTTTTEDSGGGTTTQVGGKRFVWNYYNRVERKLAVFDSTANWSYKTYTIRQSNGAVGNKVELVVGISEDAVSAEHAGAALMHTMTQGALIGIGIDSTTVNSGYGAQIFNGLSGNVIGAGTATFVGPLAAGYHYIAMLERGGSSTTCSFYGNDDGLGLQTGLTAKIPG